MLTLKETVQAIRNDLKSAKITTKQVSVRGSIQGYDDVIKVTIKDLNVKKSLVKSITDKYCSIDKCQTSGEILHGGNTHIYILLSNEALKVATNEFLEIAKEIVESSKYSKHLYKAFVNGNKSVLYSAEYNDIRISETNDGIGIAIVKFEAYGVEQIAEALAIFKYQYDFNFEVEKEISQIEQVHQEISETILSINTESLDSQEESFKAVSNMIDKVYKFIEEYNFENKQNKIELKGSVRTLKYYYNTLNESIEEQTMPDANDFNNIETLKTVYITNWNELPEELQNYILSCDKYWIDLQWINLYKDNRIVASIGISGHHKHDIEINSIGAGELFQWDTREGYTLNNLKVSVNNQENKIKVTHNEYQNIMKELASRIYTKDKELKKIIKLYCDSEEVEVDRTIYRGGIDKGVLYELYRNRGYSDLYIECYQMIICKDDLKVILTYCEGDFIVEVYNTIEEYNKGIERTKKFIEEM